MDTDEFYTHCLVKFGAPPECSLDNFWGEVEVVYGIGREPFEVCFTRWEFWCREHHDRG